MRQKIASTKCLTVILPNVFIFLLASILCVLAIPAGGKYPCDNRTQYIIINETTNNFIGCSKCNPCGLGRELVVACGSVIGNYDSTGDCKLCDPGFYHDKSDTQQCKKCKRYECFEHQVREGECPTKENRDESHCANKCIEDYTMNENGTKCDLSYKSPTNATPDRATRPTTNFTTNSTQKSKTNNSTSVINDTTDAHEVLNHSGGIPVQWIVVIVVIVILVFLLIVMTIWKRKPIVKLCRRLGGKIHKEQNDQSKELEKDELLVVNVEEKSDEEKKKKDGCSKISEQEEKSGPLYKSIQETLSGRQNTTESKCDMNTSDAVNTGPGESEKRKPEPVASVNNNTTITQVVNISVNYASP